MFRDALRNNFQNNICPIIKINTSSALYHPPLDIYAHISKKHVVQKAALVDRVMPKNRYNKQVVSVAVPL